MTGPKFIGWHDFGRAFNIFQKAWNKVAFHNSEENQVNAQLDTFQGHMFVANGLGNSLDQMYELMQRLHQKLDRIEAKIGSAPKP